MRSFITNAQTKLMMRMAGVKPEMEKGDHLLEVLGTIIIAVVLLIMFKGRITNLFQNALTATDSSVTNLFENVY